MFPGSTEFYRTMVVLYKGFAEKRRPVDYWAAGFMADSD
jgi:hypothetical protein